MWGEPSDQDAGLALEVGEKVGRSVLDYYRGESLSRQRNPSLP